MVRLILITDTLYYLTRLAARLKFQNYLSRLYFTQSIRAYTIETTVGGPGSNILHLEQASSLYSKKYNVSDKVSESVIR
jgi:hypothetical protein